jgi:hypothetical protein
MRGARWRPSVLPSGGRQTCPAGQRDHSLSGDGLGEADAVAAGLADVGVVHEPTVAAAWVLVLCHELVEAIRGWHMFVQRLIRSL